MQDKIKSMCVRFRACAFKSGRMHDVARFYMSCNDYICVTNSTFPPINLTQSLPFHTCIGTYPRYD